MLNKAIKLKSKFNEGNGRVMDGDYFNSGMSTQAQTIIEWALENAPDEKIDEWYKPSIHMSEEELEEFYNNLLTTNPEPRKWLGVFSFFIFFREGGPVGHKQVVCTTCNTRESRSVLVGGGGWARRSQAQLQVVCVNMRGNMWEYYLTYYIWYMQKLHTTYGRPVAQRGARLIVNAY
jgi:hypothetical protein